jgi:hypothetical protein
MAHRPSMERGSPLRRRWRETQPASDHLPESPFCGRIGKISPGSETKAGTCESWTSGERVQRPVRRHHIRVSHVQAALADKTDEMLNFLRRFALDGGCKPFSCRLGIVIAAISRCPWLLPPGLVQRPGIDRVETCLVHDVHGDLLQLDIIARHGDGQAAGRLAKALTPFTPLEFATRTSCPAALSLRASVPPILPVPMMPIFIASPRGSSRRGPA